MTKAIRWRIIVLQAVALLVLVFGSGLAFFASNFTSDQIQLSSLRSRSPSRRMPPRPAR